MIIIEECDLLELTQEEFEKIDGGSCYVYYGISSGGTIKIPKC